MSTHRALKILRFVAHHQEPASVKEISEHVQLPRATVYRLVMMLEKEAVLQRAGDSKLIELSGSFLRSMIAGASNEQIVAGFEQALISAANKWGATAFLGRLRTGLVEIVHAVTPPDKSSGYVHPGLNVRPAHACSSARAILAFMPQDEIDDVLGEDFTALTDRTITDRAAVLEALRLTKERGYAVCDEEVDVGITSVAVPAIVGRAGVICSIGVVAASRRMHELGLSAIGQFLKTNARNAVLGLNQSLYESRA